MLHFLALGLYCQVYKTRPTLRIFANNIFIDEFDIEPFDFKDNDSIPFLRFYHLDFPHELNEHSIKLQIKNNDSNYNNGFMTKSTLIKWHTCLIVSGDDYQYALDKIKLTHNLKFEETSMKSFNMIPYLKWKDEKNNTVDNILHLTLGGSGVFSCNLFRHLTFLRPYPLIPMRLMQVKK